MEGNNTLSREHILGSLYSRGAQRNLSALRERVLWGSVAYSEGAYSVSVACTLGERSVL